MAYFLIWTLAKILLTIYIYIQKGEKVKSYTMAYKRDVAEFAQERSIKLATSRIGLDTRRERIRSTGEIIARKPKKKRLDGGRPKPVIIKIEEKVLKCIQTRRSCMLHFFR